MKPTRRLVTQLRLQARGTGGQTPRGGPRNAARRGLDRQNYWDKRERERERDVSALLTHLPTGTP
jgi:hypothetical protein